MPGGGQWSELVLHLAVTETHQWFGIGGAGGRLRRPRRLTRDKRLPLSSSGPDYLRSAAVCRRLIVLGVMRVLRDEEFRGLSCNTSGVNYLSLSLITAVNTTNHWRETF